jgi:hypothetical protein
MTIDQRLGSGPEYPMLSGCFYPIIISERRPAHGAGCPRRLDLCTLHLPLSPCHGIASMMVPARPFCLIMSKIPWSNVYRLFRSVLSARPTLWYGETTGQFGFLVSTSPVQLLLG